MTKPVGKKNIIFDENKLKFYSIDNITSDYDFLADKYCFIGNGVCHECDGDCDCEKDYEDGVLFSANDSKDMEALTATLDMLHRGNKTGIWTVVQDLIDTSSEGQILVSNYLVEENVINKIIGYVIADYNCYYKEDSEIISIFEN